ncbi:MAG: protein-disulfide reductase DsbD family protein [Cytophagales bacterium]|nr:protein-disulfide reductase DsbD family protein [Cytophagales bacterium]
MKTSFNLVPHASFQLVGNLVPINPVDKYDDIFECDVKIFKKTGEFRQKIKILSSTLLIKGESDYQVCTETTGQCVPGGEEFSFNLKVSGETLQNQQNEKVKIPTVDNALILQSIPLIMLK